MINVVVVAGVRPHYIKLGAINYGLTKLKKETRDKINLILINTGQHYSDSLSKNYIDRFNLKFDYSFDYESKDAFDIQGEMLKKLAKCYQEIIEKYQKIDYVLIMGDVATTFIGGLAAISMNPPLKVVHLEGGLVTSKNRPEEYYRLLSDELSEYVYLSSKDNIEKLDLNKYIFIGDIIYEYLSQNLKSIVSDTITVKKPKGEEITIDLVKDKYVLASLHHKENIKDSSRLVNLFNSLAKLPYKVVFVTHPTVDSMIQKENIKIPNNVTLVDSLDYFCCMSAIYHSQFVVADSGGFQRESYYLNKRCVVINDESSYWPLIEEVGSNLCVSGLSNLQEAFDWAEKNKNKDFPYNGMFGNGDSVELMFDHLINLKGENNEK